MKPSLVLCLSLAATVLDAGCASGSAHWNDEDALACQKLEVLVGPDGCLLEIEYHVAPDQVPAAVRDAMDRRHPGGSTVGAEKEWDGGQLCWELSKQIGGLEVEAMFLPDGTLHSEEVQVRASSVPAAVRSAAEAHLGGQVRVWEEIRDGDGELVEYHVKKTANGANYKLRVSLDGAVLETFREIPAEIEVRVGG